jgi:hypothetical protein
MMNPFPGGLRLRLKWWERHLSDGQDDAGRIYVRFSSTDRVWDVLISHKSGQTRDISWLSRQ